MNTRWIRIALTSALALFAWVSVVEAGVYYKAKTSVQSSARSKIDNTTVEAWVDGPKAKVVFRESQNPITAEGTYLLTEDAGQTIFLVNPKEGTYSEMELDAMFGMLGSLSNSMGGMVKMKFGEPEIEILDEEEGDEILDLPTRHYRVRSRYSMSVKVLGMKQASETETMQDVWVTEEFEDLGLGVWLRKDPPRTGDENLDKAIAAEANKLEGFPLLSRSVANTVGGRKGKRKTTTTTTTEVVELRKLEVEPERFVLPEGLEKVEFLPPEALDPLKALRREES